MLSVETRINAAMLKSARRLATDHTVHALTETTLKLQLALEQLPWHTPDVAQNLHRWLGLMLGSEALERWEEITLGVSLTADLRGLTWRVCDSAEVFIPRLARYFELAGVAEAEMDRIAHAGASFQPERLEGWSEVYDGDINAGWAFPGVHQLAPALMQIATGPAIAPLADWAARHDVINCTHVGRAVGGADPYAQLQIPLPGADVDSQLEAGLDAFAALDVAAPPASVVMALQQANPRLSLSAWLSATGIVKLGLITPHPGDHLVFSLCRAAQQKPDEPLAAFEGALDVCGPSSIEVRRLAEGFGITLHYALSIKKREKPSV